MANVFNRQNIQALLVRLSENDNQFLEQLAKAQNVNVNFDNDEQFTRVNAAPAGGNAATRIFTNTVVASYTLRVYQRNPNPMYMILYAFYKAMHEARRRMIALVAAQVRNRRTVNITKVYFRIGMKRPTDPERASAKRIKGQFTMNALEDSYAARNVFTIEMYDWLYNRIESLIFAEDYDAEYVELDFGQHFRSINAIRHNVTFFCEATCFYKVFSGGLIEGINWYTGNQQQLRRLIGTRGDFGGKRKMFYRGSDIQFHQECKTSLECLAINPLMDGTHCFPMAILCSQVRQYTIQENQLDEKRSVATVLKTFSHALASLPLLSIPCEEKIDEFTRGGKLFLLNPFTPKDPLGWEKASKILHAYVETKLGKSIDHTSWEECPQAYCDALDIILHIFFKHEKNRFDVYSPVERTDTARHVYMYCDNNHFHPVIDIRKFTDSTSVRKLSYCDYCQRSIRYNTQSKVKEDHIMKCHLKWQFTSEHVADFLRISTLKPQLHIKYTHEVKPMCNEHDRVNCDCGGMTTPRHMYECTICGHVGDSKTLSYQHRCYFSKPKPKELLANEKLFVLDIESMQKLNEESNKYVHEFVLMCVRNVYDENQKFEFFTVNDFMIQLRDNPVFENSLFIAHNGGGYDYQFFIQHLEQENMDFQFVPRPSSDHKYISLSILFTHSTVNFIDFMCLIPGSLKGIAQSFQLDVQKGDFPHRFLSPDTYEYSGCIPPLHSPSDFYSLHWKKNEKDLVEVEEWYEQQCLIYCTCTNECTCMKKKWVCKDFLKEYCWIDVHVLANACQKYRNLLLMVQPTGGSWNPTPIDPFQYLTQSQLAMQIFLSGFSSFPEIGISLPRHFPSNMKRYAWYHRLQVQNPMNTYIHLGTNPTKYVWMFALKTMDCYCLDNRTVYEFVNEGDTFNSDDLDELKSKGFIADYVVMHERDLMELDNYELEVMKLAGDRDFFFGGRTEVFSPYSKPDEDEEIKYLDVCSLYPTICSFAMLPTGHPIMYFGSQCHLERLNTNHSDPYFGFVRCKVKPNKKDILGLLPCKLESGKLVFNLHDKVGMWFTEEIYLAMKHGYEIVEIYEIHHFDERNRSDTLMRGYMESFLQLKQESEGWKKLGASSETPSEEEKDRIVEQLFESNGNIGRVRKDQVTKNPVLRQVSKIFLNCLWGKFCQKQKADFFTELTSYKDYEAVLNLPEGNDMTFRQMNGARWRVKYSKPTELLPFNRRYNIYLAAAVTAQARCYLHRQMIHIGPPRILYCDTDSIVFLNPKNAPPLTGIGLGKWTDEHPNEIISEFFALAPKCYMLNIESEISIKAKGCIMSLENQKKLDRERILGLIESYCVNQKVESIELANFSIFTNSNDIQYAYGTMFSRYNNKQIRCVLNKRILITEYNQDDSLGENISRVTLLPEGYVT